MKKNGPEILGRARSRLARSQLETLAIKTAVLEDALEISKFAWDDPATHPNISSYVETITPAVGSYLDFDVARVIECFSRKGFFLADKFLDRPDGTGIQGRVSGQCLLMLADGSMARLSRSGTWSNHLPDGGDRWTATLEYVPVARAAADFSIERLLRSLADGLRLLSLRTGMRDGRAAGV